MGHLLLTAIIAFLFLIPYALYMDQLEQNAHDRVLGEPDELARPFPSLCPPVQVPEPVVFSAPGVQDLPALPFTRARLY